MSRGGAGLPVGRYGVALVLAPVAFMGIAVVEQRDVFLSAWGVAAGPAEPAASAGPSEMLVRAFLTALDEAHASGSSQALDAVALSPDVRAEYADALAFEVAHGRSAPRLARLEVLTAHARGGDGFEVLTDETWAAAGSASRMRFRYVVRPAAGALRIDEASPLLPEPPR